MTDLSKNKSHFVRSFVNKDRSDDLRKCSVLAVDRNSRAHRGRARAPTAAPRGGLRAPAPVPEGCAVPRRARARFCPGRRPVGWAPQRATASTATSVSAEPAFHTHAAGVRSRLCSGLTVSLQAVPPFLTGAPSS